MQQNNILYDILVLGTCDEGLELISKLKSKNKKLLIGIILDNSDANLDKIANLDISIIKGEVKYSNYLRGLIELTLDSLEKVFCKKLLVAPKLLAADTDLNSLKIPQSYVSKDEILPVTKEDIIAIIGSSEVAVDAALDLSKKASYVYLCNPEIKLSCSTLKFKKLEAKDNIAHLSNGELKGFILDKTGNLAGVELSNYEIIRCSKLLFATETKIPKIWLAEKMISYDPESKKIKVDSNCTTENIPSIFAVGPCCSINTKAARSRLLQKLETEFVVN